MRLLAGVLVVSFVACCPKEPRDGGTACEPNPEPRAEKMTVARGRNANGMGLNGARSLDGSFLGVNAAFLSDGASLDGIAVGGAELRNVTLASGNELGAGTLRGAALVGAKLFGLDANGNAFEVVISTYEREGELAWYRLTENGENACPDGGRGMFVPGVWDARGQQAPSRTTIAQTATTSFSCMDGAIAKCVVWGWAPWKAGPTSTRRARAWCAQTTEGTGPRSRRTACRSGAGTGRGPTIGRPTSSSRPGGSGTGRSACIVHASMRRRMARRSTRLAGRPFRDARTPQTRCRAGRSS